jgi:hypothetical protein
MYILAHILGDNVAGGERLFRAESAQMKLKIAGRLVPS